MKSSMINSKIKVVEKIPEGYLASDAWVCESRKNDYIVFFKANGYKPDRKSMVKILMTKDEARIMRSVASFGIRNIEDAEKCAASEISSTGYAQTYATVIKKAAEKSIKIFRKYS